MPRSRAALARRPDGEILSILGKAVFSAGFSWRVVGQKWPACVAAFHGFEPERVATLAIATLRGLVQLSTYRTTVRVSSSSSSVIGSFLASEGTLGHDAMRTPEDPRATTGEGQWVDMSCSEAGAAMLGTAVLDYTVNGRPTRREGSPHSKRDSTGTMAPHGIYATAGEDNWIAISVRSDDEWSALADEIGEEWARSRKLASLTSRLQLQDALDADLDRWTRAKIATRSPHAFKKQGIPAAAVARPAECIEEDPATMEWGLWPKVEHPAMGEVRVDGVPAHLSESDRAIDRVAPLLGADTDYVFGDFLGLGAGEIAAPREQG